MRQFIAILILTLSSMPLFAQGNGQGNGQGNSQNNSVAQQLAALQDQVNSQAQQIANLQVQLIDSPDVAGHTYNTRNKNTTYLTILPAGGDPVVNSSLATGKGDLYFGTDNTGSLAVVDCTQNSIQITGGVILDTECSGSPVVTFEYSQTGQVVDAVTTGENGGAHIQWLVSEDGSMVVRNGSAFLDDIGGNDVDFTLHFMAVGMRVD